MQNLSGTHINHVTYDPNARIELVNSNPREAGTLYGVLSQGNTDALNSGQMSLEDAAAALDKLAGGIDNATQGIYHTILLIWDLSVSISLYHIYFASNIPYITH